VKNKEYGEGKAGICVPSVSPPFASGKSTRFSHDFLVGGYATRFDVRIKSGHHGLKGGIGFDFVETGFYVVVDLNSLTDNQAAVSAVVRREFFEQPVGPLVEVELFPHS